MGDAGAQKRRKPKARTQAGEAFTRLIIEVFRLNGCLLAVGDHLTKDLGLTSARWQVLGAIDDGPLPVAQIARNMGLTRQAVQRVADDLAAQGFVTFGHNPNHQRAKLVGLSDKGRKALNEVNRQQVAWANRTAAKVNSSTLDKTTMVLGALRTELEGRDPDEGEGT
jgi:DNA-binding MarR family transcriptional regulator